MGSLKLVCYRHAVANDLEPLLDLIERGFSVNSDSVVDRKQGKEHRVLFSYLYAKKGWDPDWVYLAEQSGRLLAAVGVFPQRLFFDGVEIPVWSVSPVVADPDFRRKGYAGACLNQALEGLKGRGIPAVFLWGAPKYYPRFGFVPILPRYKTKLARGKIIGKVENKGGFRESKIEDLPLIGSIYNSGNECYWLQPKRDLKWWQERFKEMGIKEALLKEVPFPEKENLLVWENNKGEVKGYLNFLEEPDHKIVINESAAGEADTAMEMVTSFAAEFFPEKTLHFRGTPIHSLNAAAYRLGGTHINPAPLAGMVKIIDWSKFIDYLLPILNERTRSLTTFKDGDYLELDFLAERQSWIRRGSKGWEINLDLIATLNPEQQKLLTKLVFGFYDSIDLSLFHTRSLMIRRLFPMKYPFIWDNNYLY